MMMLLEEAEPHTFLTAAFYDYEKELNSYAYAKTHNRAICQDLVQEAYVRTWQYLERQGEIATMKSFLYRVLNNLIIDEYRKRKTFSLDMLLEKGYEPSADPSERLINALDGRAGLELINQLPRSYQKVMRMRYVEGLSLKEIALATHQSRNTIGVQLHRGLNKLKTLYNRTPHARLARI